MTKKQWIDRVAAFMDCPKVRAKWLWNFLSTENASALSFPHGDGVVPVPGIGKIRRKYRRPTTKRNPNTGEAIEVPARLVAALRESAEFKAFMNPESASIVGLAKRGE